MIFLMMMSTTKRKLATKFGYGGVLCVALMLVYFFHSLAVLVLNMQLVVHADLCIDGCPI
eukprot:m.849282 g.849282  ORF g.849282 m.849282 type:complete len:60 (-) comp23490_c2_seq38:4012-4191(-)